MGRGAEIAVFGYAGAGGDQVGASTGQHAKVQ